MLQQCNVVPSVPQDLLVDIPHTESEGLSQEHLQRVPKEEEVHDSNPTLEHSSRECMYVPETETKRNITIGLLTCYINSLNTVYTGIQDDPLHLSNPQKIVAILYVKY